MKTFAIAAALTILTATTTALAAQTQEQPAAQSRSIPNTSSGSYQHRDSSYLNPGGAIGAAEPDPASCRLKREAMKDAATSTAFAATAAQDGMVEVALAGLALRKSGDNQLRQFAEKMVEDYAQSNGGLDLIVKCEGLILPVELDA